VIAYVAPLKRPRKRGSSALLQRLFDHALGVCAYCWRLTALTSGRGPLVATIDHVIPRSKGGGNARTNLTLACRHCNGMKGNMMPEEWSAYMAAHPRWWEYSRSERRQRRAFVKQALPASREASLVLRGGFWIEK
jgi:5-methylcytosine-specific restriction endonuclease McrA